MREHHRLAGATAGAVLLAAWATASAAAHAVIQPSASRPADLQRYTLTVPNERNEPTVEVRLEVPDGIDFFLVEDKLGWQTHVEKRNGRTVAVVFDRGSIRPGFYDTFRFIAKNPVREGTIAWNVIQSYRGGEVVEWIGPPGSDTPAARTVVSESATPVDTVDVASGKPSPAAAAPAAAGSAGHDRLLIVLSLAALVLALVALAIPVLRGRPLA
jgi:uncharacterized protein YcnI